jgi:hypothetical protein
LLKIGGLFTSILEFAIGYYINLFINVPLSMLFEFQDSVASSSGLLESTVYQLCSCKVLPNKDHTTCGKERFIRNQTAGLSLLGSECSGLTENGWWALQEGPSHGGRREFLVSDYL